MEPKKLLCLIEYVANFRMGMKQYMQQKLRKGNFTIKAHHGRRPVGRGSDSCDRKRHHTPPVLTLASPDQKSIPPPRHQRKLPEKTEQENIFSGGRNFK